MAEPSTSTGGRPDLLGRILGRDNVNHPANVYLSEKVILPILDDWLLKLFAPHRIDDTIRAMVDAQPTTAAPAPPVPDATTTELLAGCDAKLDKYRAVLEAGVDPETVIAWIREVKAERAKILSDAAARHRSTESPTLSEDDIRGLVGSMSQVRCALQKAAVEDRAEIYGQMGLRLTYESGKQNVRVEINLDPDNAGITVCVRGGFDSLTPRNPWVFCDDLHLAYSTP